MRTVLSLEHEAINVLFLLIDISFTAALCPFKTNGFICGLKFQVKTFPFSFPQTTCFL